MAKLKLITETSHEIEISESKSKGMSIVGIFSSAEIENSNNRKYKRSLLEREKSKIDEKVNGKSLWGELGHPACILGNTEILTYNGWKEIKDISNNEIVATLNPETKNIEYHEIDKKIILPYKGEMYKFKNRQIDISFTPTHRHLLINRYNKHLFANSKDIDECKTRKYNKCYIPKTGTWTPDEESNEYITLKGIPKKPHSKYDYSNDINIDMKTFMGFLGIYLSEGNVTKNNKNRISIYQNEGESANLIRELLSNFPKEMEWHETNKNGKIIFALSDERLAKILKPLGICYNKYIPYEFKQLDSIYLYELLYWFGIGDGRGFLTDDYKKDLFSTSEKLIDDLHEIAFKCGISARKTVEICKVDYKFADRIIKKGNRQPLYFLKIYTTKGIYLDERFMKIEKENFEGNVYCVQVKNENFYIRNDNSVSFWTGNSPEINPDKIAILTTMLEWKGNDLFGKAKVLDTPMGNITKTLVKEGKVGISSRGLGTVGDDGYVNEDFNLITWDIVTDPSNHPSWVSGIYEGREWDIPIKEKQPTLEEAKKAHERQIWQVIAQIEKNI